MRIIHIAIAGTLLFAACAPTKSNMSAPNFEDEAHPFASELKCVGTEPFWSLALSTGSVGYHDRAEYLDMEGNARTFTLERPQSNGEMTLNVNGHNDADKSAVHLTLERTGQCSDGMSDTIFEYSLELTQQDHPTLRGCCSQKGQ